MKSNWEAYAPLCDAPCSEVLISIAWMLCGLVGFSAYILADRSRTMAGGWLSHLALDVLDVTLKGGNLLALIPLKAAMLGLKIGMLFLKLQMLILKVRILLFQVFNVTHNNGFWCGVCYLFSPNV